jgi:hypothetical protein
MSGERREGVCWVAPVGANSSSLETAYSLVHSLRELSLQMTSLPAAGSMSYVTIRPPESNYKNSG